MEDTGRIHKDLAVAYDRSYLVRFLFLLAYVETVFVYKIFNYEALILKQKACVYLQALLFRFRLNLNKVGRRLSLVHPDF